MTTVEQVFDLYSAQEPEGWRVERVEGRVVPDLTLATRGSFRNALVWQAPDPVLLVTEVTSAFTAHRDRVQKARAYARAGIPVYLLIDRETGEAVVHSEPSGDSYGHASVHRLGTVVPLPAPVPRALETTEL